MRLGRGAITVIVSVAAGLALLIGVTVVFAAPTVYTFVSATLEGGGSGAGSGESVRGAQPRVEDDEDFGEVAIYDVLADGNLEPEAAGVAGEVWQLWLRIVGTELAGDTILQYRAGNAPESDTLAYVYQETDPTYWNLAVNLSTADDPQLLISTLIHEYAHIFSFNAGDFDLGSASCDTLELAEGCAAQASYLYRFYQDFWSGYGDIVDVENVDEDVANEFYLQHEDDFVNDYAATSLGEDFAESFMTFVIEDVPEGKSVVATKLRFFTQFPELVALRDHIRAELAVELGLR
ncbi:MAG: NADH:ubiquinone oxidoreductase subunit 4 (chain M) [Microbacteriaceae bacterium]